MVSCQALSHEPLHGPQNMALMAKAAQAGGAVGIRANSGADIAAIKAAVDLPVIGIKKKAYDASDIYITPTLEDALEIAAAGADCIAIDLTDRYRPGGQKPEDLIKAIRAHTDVLIMADISVFEEGVYAQELGVDLVSTTLSGYTPYSPRLEGPDFELMERLAHTLNIPVCGEGRIWTREDAARAYQTGIFALIIGSAITRPQDITRRFVHAVQATAKA